MAIEDTHKEPTDPFGRDSESEELARSPEFWRMIEERRREPTISWEDVKRKLAMRYKRID